MGIKITSFSGIAPKAANRNIPDNMAQIADNCRLISGGLRAYSDKLAVATNTLKTGDIKTVARLSDGSSDYWLSWLDDVDMVRSQVVGDAQQRIYWTGDSEPRVTSLAMAISGGGVMPDSCFVLGVPAPLVAPTVTPSGGVGATVSRAYVETFVTPWGEEGAPSPVSAVTSGKVDATWALTALNAAPPNSAAITGAVHAAGIVTVETGSTKYLRAGEEVVHASVVGMTDLNGTFNIKAVVDATHYTVDLTTAQTYTSGGTWTRAAPHNTTGMTRRIYRTVLGEYFFVAEIAIGTTTYNDTLLDSDLGELIPSIGWDMPPVGMKGLIALPNGINAAISGFDIMFCEPWRPHAWPAAYGQSCIFEPVGLGAFGSSIVVGTKGLPHIITGYHPGSMSMEKGRQLRPCLSKRSMVGVGIGVLYSSPDGLAFENGSGEDLATKPLFSRDEWQQLNPSTMSCCYQNGIVFGWHDQNSSLHTGFAFDISSGAFASTSMPTTAQYVDPETNSMYVASGGGLFQWDSHPYNDIVYDWKSKVFSLSRPVNYGYARLDADFSGVSATNDAIAADTAYNEAVLASGVTDGELDSHMLDEYALDGSLLRGGSLIEYSEKTRRLTVYADGVEKYTEVVQNIKAFTLPSGFKANNWEFRISGNIPAFGLYVAENAKGLAQL